MDRNGDNVEHDANPDLLKNYFGANPDAPDYLTPVHFRREVLAKYYAEPERYNISDGRLTCLTLWSCQIDNNLQGRVVVFLGDLGRDLPHDEQLHWRQFNIPPEGTISETNYRRSFEAEFTDAEASDLRFRRAYTVLRTEWVNVHSWPIFLDANAGDAHLIDTVRIPVTNSQSEFDEQIIHLTKLLVDSLNEKELATRSTPLSDGVKGIGKLDGFLAAAGFPERESLVQVLRDLQSLRSTGSAHRKGSAYAKMLDKLNIDSKNKAAGVTRFLDEMTRLMNSLRAHFCETCPKC